MSFAGSVELTTPVARRVLNRLKFVDKFHSDVSLQCDSHKADWNINTPSVSKPWHLDQMGTIS